VAVRLSHLVTTIHPPRVPRARSAAESRATTMRITLLSAASLVLLPIAASAQEYDAERNSTVNAGGATSIRIDARAGQLRVTGRTDLTEVRVRGTARASTRDLVDAIKLEAVRNGTQVEVRAVLPESRDWRWDEQALLDLVIEVPAAMAVEIDDTSGDLTVESVSGKIRVEDNSGNIRVRDVGDVWISDSSGDIEVRGVKGSVDIEDDSSGEIEVYDVIGSVRVGRDSSGSIDVSRVGGDFTVERDGSGSIDHADVKGKVDIPRQRYHR
jgi:hypothetical protein